MTTENIKLLIADDHPIILKGLKYIILQHFPDCPFEEVSSVYELNRILAANNFTHLILDLNLNDGTALDILPDITNRYPDLHILIYSMASEDIYARNLLNFRISGFMSKNSSETEILNALHVFFEGGYYISRSLKTKMQGLNQNADTNIFSTLSPSELKVVINMLKGYRSKEIASLMGVKPQTVTTYKSRIFEKLGTNNILDIQRLADLYNVSFS